MAIHKILLDNCCWEYYSDAGETFWVTVFDSNGYREVHTTYWRDPPGGTEWSKGPYDTQAEAIYAGEITERF